MEKHSAIRAELGTLVRLALPLAAAQVGLMAMGFVDVAVTGRLGAVATTAVGLGNGLTLTLSILGLGILMGLDPLVAQALGARDPLGARRLLWQSVWLSFAVTFALFLPLAGLPFLLEPFGVAQDISGQTRSYVLVRLLSLLPTLMFAGLRSYLQATRVVWPLVVSVLVANVANYAFDVLFVFGYGPIPAMGAPGAALATVFCSFLQLGMVALGVRTVRVEGFGRGMRAPVWPEVRRAFRVGLPVGLQMMAEVGVFALAGFLAARMGAVPGAAHQVALTLASASFCGAVGISSAGAVRVGHGIGARDLAATRRSGLLAFAVGAGFMAVCAGLFVLFPYAIARSLTDKADVLAASVPLLGVAAAFQISDGLQAVGSGVLRGAGDTRFAFLANLVGHWAIGLPIAIVAGLVFHHGVVGLWYGLAAGLTAVALALFVRFLRLSSRPIRALDAKDDRALPAA